MWMNSVILHHFPLEVTLYVCVWCWWLIDGRLAAFAAAVCVFRHSFKRLTELAADSVPFGCSFTFGGISVVGHTQTHCDLTANIFWLITFIQWRNRPILIGSSRMTLPNPQVTRAHSVVIYVKNHKPVWPSHSLHHNPAEHLEILKCWSDVLDWILHGPHQNCVKSLQSLSLQYSPTYICINVSSYPA